MPTRRLIWICFVISSAIFGSSTYANAQEDSFFRGKTMTLLIGFGTGGGYDTYGRSFIRHFRNHIPGTPDIVLQNMPGAGGLTAGAGAGGGWGEAFFTFSLASPSGAAAGAVPAGVGTGASSLEAAAAGKTKTSNNIRAKRPVQVRMVSSISMEIE
jgi:hypothetical protein